jgi:hypothetical protein
VLVTYEVKSAEPGREGEWGRRASYANVDLRTGESACFVCDEIIWPEAVRVTSVQGQPEPYAPPRVADERVPEDVPVALRPTRTGYGWQRATVLPSVDPESLDEFLTRDEPTLRRQQFRFDDVPIHWARTGSPSDFAG